MNLADLNVEFKIIKKAGLIPYVMVDTTPLFMFMIPSDPSFGGSKPNIAKGGVDNNESYKEAAIREAGEELGLKPNNLIYSTFHEIWDGILSLKKLNYAKIYICQVKDKNDFYKPGFETGSTLWLTNEEFQKLGRPDHKKIVSLADVYLT